jgi:hypothetical protein
MQLTVAANVAKGANKIQVRWPYPVINEALLSLVFHTVFSTKSLTSSWD